MATTGEDGLYHFPLLASGVYSLSVQKAGFKQATREDLRLELSQIARVDFTLTPGVVSETVEVEASAPLLESNTSSVGQVIETEGSQRPAAERPKLRATGDPRARRNGRGILSIRHDRQRNAAG